MDLGLLLTYVVRTKRYDVKDTYVFLVCTEIMAGIYHTFLQAFVGIKWRIEWHMSLLRAAAYLKDPILSLLALEWLD